VLVHQTASAVESDTMAMTTAVTSSQRGLSNRLADCMLLTSEIVAAAPSARPAHTRLDNPVGNAW